MSQMGLGCVKTPERDRDVEAFRRNCPTRESNHAAHGPRGGALKNSIFYIFPMYEFSHSHGFHPSKAQPPCQFTNLNLSGPRGAVHPAVRAMSALPPIATSDIASCPLCAIRDQIAPQQMIAYSITSSARASTDGGIVNPSAFAVSRLTVSAYLVGF